MLQLFNFRLSARKVNTVVQVFRRIRPTLPQKNRNDDEAAGQGSHLHQLLVVPVPDGHRAVHGRELGKGYDSCPVIFHLYAPVVLQLQGHPPLHRKLARDTSGRSAASRWAPSEVDLKKGASGPGKVFCREGKSHPPSKEIPQILIN